ncbi:ANTAR domain-containing protein [Pedococcus cremeus]|uniref:ANTAR domain-containing protein n=1 Tax=Pedococcus cremeus TaxID=587636 RepID=UPI000B88466A|nr:ANTAR domain-containing protein [Pedococcus cremeus]
MSADATPEPVAQPSVTIHEDPVVEQAKGILAVMFAITPGEALLVMRAFAGAEFPTLGELAAHVVAVATEPPGGPDVARHRLTLLLFAEGGAP